MSADKHSISKPYFHPDDPAGCLKPGEPFMVDGLDWAWAFVWYKEVEGFPGYAVGTNGRVWTRIETFNRPGHRGCSSRLGETWAPRAAPLQFGRYPFVNLSKQGKKTPKKIHVLVLETFMGPRPLGHYGCHFDDDSGNNNLYNLHWGTPKSNKKDAAANGRIARGEANGRATISKEDAARIRAEYDPRTTNTSHESKKYRISRTHFRRIAKGEFWRDS